MTAVCVSLGYMLAGIPNVELMTITTFVAGYLLGPGLGALVGAISITLHSVFNPLGAALPPLLLAQIAGFSVVGVTGGLLGPVVARMERRIGALLVCAILGFVLTLFYDVLSNVGAFYVITGENAPQSLVQFVAAGVAFMVMHLVWNTAIFLVVLKPVLNVLARH